MIVKVRLGLTTMVRIVRKNKTDKQSDQDLGLVNNNKTIATVSDLLAKKDYDVGLITCSNKNNRPSI